MFEKLKGNILFEQLLKRRNIDKAYAMVGPEDSWYDTITTVHNSLKKIREYPYEDWQTISHDGLALKGIYYPGQSEDTLIWVHGYTSHAERESAFPALFYKSLGFNVLIPYLRSHGPSAGKYISFGALESRDIMLWVEKVNQLHPQGRILIHGLSMGGATVLNLSDKEMTNVKGLIADAPNVSIKSVFQNIANNVFKKDKKKDQILDFALRRFYKEFGVSASDFEALDIIKNSRYPLLLSAGSNENLDDLLAELKANNPMDTTVVILPGCNHGNGMYKQTEMYQNAIKEFISANNMR